MRHHRRHPLGNFLFALTLSGTAVALLLATSRPGWSDDRDLLRFDTAQPYLFILLDTSASMNLAMGAGNAWVPGGADNPDSRLYQAKAALFHVLESVSDVRFGFASYNQDHLAVLAKHWIYFPNGATSTQTPPSGWPLGTFPIPDPDGALTKMVDTNGDGVPDTRAGDIQGDILTFGAPYASPTTAGTCSAPLDLDTTLGREQAQSFAIDPRSGQTTTFYLAHNKSTHLVTATVQSGLMGASTIVVDLKAYPACSSADTPVDYPITLSADPNLNQTLVILAPPAGLSAPGSGGGNKASTEAYADLWPHSDVYSDATYGDLHPFTGNGWDSNYDSGAQSGDATFDANLTWDDYFFDPSTASLAPANRTIWSSDKPIVQTTYDSLGHAMDRGDVIPFDWRSTGASTKTEFLQRLAPNYQTTGGAPDFKVADYFNDLPTAPTTSNPDPGPYLQPVNPNIKPLIAVDGSPLAKSINDVRCWYLGYNSNKCKDSHDFNPGWQDIACANDSSYGCRKPYFLIISDGEDTSPGSEDPNGDVGSLNSQAGVQTWALDVGDPKGCSSGGDLHSIVQAGKGICVVADTRDKLRAALQAILGQIRTQATSFASAAVPSVQATTEQKIYLSSFVPTLTSANVPSSVWNGHMYAFLKPLPVDTQGKPDLTQVCSLNSLTQGCLLWDAAKEMCKEYPITATPDYSQPQQTCPNSAYRDPTSTTNPPPSDPNSYLSESNASLRRVYYSELPTAGSGWIDQWSLLTANKKTNPPSDTVNYDLWRGLGLISDTVADGTLTSTQEATLGAQSKQVLVDTLAMKQGLVNTVDPSTGQPIQVTVSYLLGDIFHSTPVVVGTPANSLFFEHDKNANVGVTSGSNPPACDGSGNNKGYRCFYSREQYRRKVLLVGSDDGMVHGFDAGQFKTTGTDPNTGVSLNQQFNNGTGRELFAYVPREVMSKLPALASGTTQQYTVDGTINAADVFIDPTYYTDLAAGPVSDSQREWRSVAVAGLREGGRGYYALDVTQPDTIQTDTTAGLVPDQSAGVVPDCTTDPTSTGSIGGASGCQGIHYPAALWEFTDSVRVSTNEDGHALTQDVALDEDNGEVGNGQADLGDTWSTPNLGVIRVCKAGGTLCNPNPPSTDPHAGDDVVDKYVAIFGGGMDVSSKADPSNANTGNWLYMVDIETGQVIYKQQLVGAAPSEPAAVDTNEDGYINRIYIGTIAGFLYRVDLTPDATTGELPALQDVSVHGINGKTYTAANGIGPRIPNTSWQPHIVFNANYDGGVATATARPIYERPSVIFLARLGSFAVAFGTGDREDLWTSNGQTGRFYVFVDPNVDVNVSATIYNENDNMQPIDPNSPNNTAEPNYLLNSNGWYMTLQPDERVITQPVAVSGVTVFSSYIPEIVDQNGVTITVGCGSTNGNGGSTGGSGGTLCTKQGTSQIYVLNTTNGNGFLQDTTGAFVRFSTVNQVVSNIFGEPSQTKQSTNGTGSSGGTTANADTLTPAMQQVMNTLRRLFPARCKFANYRIDLKTIASDTSLQFIAPVPVCIMQSNWKEF